MKTIYFLFTTFSFLLLLTACDNNDNQKNQLDDLVGFWKINQITGGFSGAGYTPDFTEVQFNRNGTYRIHNHDEPKGDGTYSLVTEDNKLILKLTPDDAMNLVFETPEKEVIFEREKLILRDPCCDLYEYEFSRDNN